MTYLAMDEFRVDALKELNSMAAGNTATSLSRLFGRRVRVSIPSLTIEPVEKVPDAMGGEEVVATVIYFGVSGAITGSILLILSLPASLKYVKLLTGNEKTGIDQLNEMELSALKELGNISAGTYCRMLARGLGLRSRITHSIPGFAHDMLGAVLDGILAPVSLRSDAAVLAENRFRVGNDTFQAHLIFILDPASLDFVLEGLKGEK